MEGKKENILDELIDKVKGSEAYAQVNQAIEKATDIVEEKIAGLKNSDLPGQAADLCDKAETGAEALIDHVKAVGGLLADDVEEVIDQVKAKRKGGPAGSKPA